MGKKLIDKREKKNCQKNKNRKETKNAHEPKLEQRKEEPKISSLTFFLCLFHLVWIVHSLLETFFSLFFSINFSRMSMKCQWRWRESIFRALHSVSIMKIEGIKKKLSYIYNLYSCRAIENTCLKKGLSFEQTLSLSPPTLDLPFFSIHIVCAFHAGKLPNQRQK